MIQIETMANKFLKPNWHSINKAIEAGELKELRKEQESIKRKIQEKIDLHYKQKRIAEAAAKVKALRTLPAGAVVFYIGKSKDIPFGAEGKKLFVARNGIKRMSVEFNGMPWNCYYTNLQIEPPSGAQTNSHNITQRLSKALSNYYKTGI